MKLRWSSAVVKELRVVSPADAGAKKAEPHKCLRKRSLSFTDVVTPPKTLSFAEVRSMFRDADYVRGYVVFNIRRNRYRLITVIHYAKTTDEKRTLGHVYIRSFLTHKEYNDPRKWDRRFGTQ